MVRLSKSLFWLRLDSLKSSVDSKSVIPYPSLFMCFGHYLGIVREKWPQLTLINFNLSSARICVISTETIPLRRDQILVNGLILKWKSQCSELIEEEQRYPGYLERNSEGGM